MHAIPYPIAVLYVSILALLAMGRFEFAESKYVPTLAGSTHK